MMNMMSTGKKRNNGKINERRTTLYLLEQKRNVEERTKKLNGWLVQSSDIFPSLCYPARFPSDVSNKRTSKPRIEIESASKKLPN